MQPHEGQPAPVADRAEPQRRPPDASASAPAALLAMVAELRGALQALAALARSELELSLALLLRAGVLALVGLLLLLMAVVLAGATLVAFALALGLSWPAALATSMGVLMLMSWLSWRRAVRHLRDCGLPRTRAELGALRTLLSATSAGQPATPPAGTSSP